MSVLFIALTSIALSVAAQFSLKSGMSSESVKALLAQPLSIVTAFKVLMNAHVLGGFLLYGLGAVVWLAVLSRWDVSKAYPLVGLGFVLTAAIGAAIGEQVTLMRIVGIAFIFCGVFMVSRS